MIKVENIKTWGFEHAIRGMRNSMNSWDKSDSYYNSRTEEYVIGPNDLDLMQRLYKAGPEHRKYLRQIFVSMDIIAPLYWWKEFSTYKVGVVENSCSTMHTIHKKEFTIDDFSHEHLDEVSVMFLQDIIKHLNVQREYYNKTNDRSSWWVIIQLLPTSYNQKRTVTMNYENVFNIINQRMGHKLTEWNEFVEILKGLPYVKEILGGSDDAAVKSDIDLEAMRLEIIDALSQGVIDTKKTQFSETGEGIAIALGIVDKYIKGGQL